eukprot:Partr_v1_DN26727_c0_g1_i3_m8802 putative Splicing factor 3b subunit
MTKRKRKVIEKKWTDPIAQAPRKQEEVQVEYVVPEVDKSIPEEFQRIFDHFKPVDPEPEVDTQMMDSKSSNAGSDSDSEDAAEDSSDPEDGDSGSDNGASQKRKDKKARRPTVAQLKQQVSKPDMVEWWDVAAADPLLLIHLKSMRNTVRVPMHWSLKRKYLARKRGLETSSYELPSYIADTGIGSMREAVAEKEDSKSLGSKMRSKTHGSVSKVSIDYARLHDAFFRFQTKPHLTIHGDLYREGKEFEVVRRERKPGVYSQELKEALGMTHPLLPPPWLLNMQRFGPPPSYPSLKIAGLNDPIPEGAQWGYHPGGWGKPPVDEFNRPLYGDIFGMQTQYQRQVQESIEASNLGTKPEREPWGEITMMYNELDEFRQQSDDEAEGEHDDVNEEEEEVKSAPVPQPISSIEITSQPRENVVAQVLSQEREEEEEEVILQKDEKQLYQVLGKGQGKSGFMGSEHTYALPGGTKRTGDSEDIVEQEKPKASVEEAPVAKKRKVTDKKFKF